jgi:heat-inducible transcriptional repressor
MLTPRRIEIFKAIIEEFIRTAEPVGSKALMERYHLPYSSATIRNDMQVLEEMGYLEKTHTSSGRIPSTAGYKFYCENLLNDAQVDQKTAVAIRSAFEAANLNIDEAVQQSCKILSEMTNMTAGAIGPDSSAQRLNQIKLFPLDERNAVCVFITDTGHTETKNFRFEEDVSAKDIAECTDVLNERLKNTPVTELSEKLQAIKPILAASVKRYELLFQSFVQAFAKFASENENNVYVSGKSKLLYQPEFHDIEKLKQLMSMLDDNRVWRSLPDSKKAMAVKTSHGAELTWVDDVAIVKSSFHVSEGEEGQLMVVGPSRMNYEKVVSMIEYAARMIEKMYSGNGGNNDSGR